MAPRRRSNRTRYLDEREIRGRSYLLNAARAGSPEPYDRRRASLGTVGDPEIAGRLGSGVVPTLANTEGGLPQEKLPNVPEAKLPNLGKAKLPGDTVYGSSTGRVRANTDIDWGEGRPVPPGKVGEGYKYEDLADRPKLGKYLTRADVKQSALK